MGDEEPTATVPYDDLESIHRGRMSSALDDLITVLVSHALDRRQHAICDAQRAVLVAARTGGVHQDLSSRLRELETTAYADWLSNEPWVAGLYELLRGEFDLAAARMSQHPQSWPNPAMPSEAELAGRRRDARSMR